MSKRRQKAEIAENISPNLIPMIDIMFLLLLFFMLSADMTQRELEDVVVPEADRAKEADQNTSKEEKSTIVNVHHAPDGPCSIYANGGTCREEGHWKWAIRGKNYDKDTLKEALSSEAQLNMEPAPDPVAKKILSARLVLIRADARAPYGYVQKVIEVCGAVGIYKVEVAAALPAAQK